MGEPYKEFDKTPIVDTSDVVIKGFRFRVRELALGAVAVVCLLVIIILAALLASAKSSDHNGPASVLPGSSAQTGGNCGPNTCNTAACLKTAAHVAALVNVSADKPCDDFHSFACYNFPMQNPLTPDESEVTSSWLIYYRNQDKLRRLLEKQSSVSLSPYHWDSKLKNFFASCNDHFYKMKLQGRPFLQRVVAPSGGWWALQSEDQWASGQYSFQRQLEQTHVDFWTNAFFTFSIVTDWLDWNKAAIQIDLSGIGVSYFYFTEIEYQAQREAYKQFMRTVGGLLLRDAGVNLTAQEKAARVETFVNDAYSVENELATIKKFSEAVPDPHSLDKRVKLSELNARSSGALDWVRLFSHMFDRADVTADTYVIVAEQDYVNKFTRWISELDSANKSRTLNNYLVWRLAHRYVQDLSWDYIHANREIHVNLTNVADFLGTWRYCISKVDSDMNEALGALFVKDHFSDQNRRTAHEITKYVKRALSENLKSAMNWMSPETRQTAAKKLDETLFKLGYPDYLMQDNTLNQVYSPLNINRNDYFGNLLSFNAYYKADWNRRLANQNDRTVWAYPTYSFVAEYYNPWKELIIPAGLLQFPVYDHTSPQYMNFGSMGSIVAKQLVHAIDEIGNFYMMNGSHYGSWWSNSTTQKYQTVKKCIIDAYKNVSMGPFNVQGMDEPLTIPANAVAYAPVALGESSGVRLAYQAYKDWLKVTGPEQALVGHMYTNDQLFFISYAQTYCFNRNPMESLNNAVFSSNLPENLKVNGALMQLKEFQTAFQCSDNSKMVAKKHCSLY